MKILVCGDRNWTSMPKIERKLRDFADLHGNNGGFPGSLTFKRIKLIHGDCQGADRIAGTVGKCLGMKVVPFPADWKKHGKLAGPIRNREMLDQKPDLVIAFHASIGKSKGTWDCIKEANRRGIPVEIIP